MKRSVYWQNILTGAVIIVIAVAAFVLALPMPQQAAVFPKIVAAVLGILGALLVLTTAVRMAKGEAIDEQALDPRILIRPLIFFAMIILYVVLIRVIGFYVTTAAALVVYMYVMGIHHPKTLAITTVSVMVLIYLVFTMALKVRLPKGIFM